MYQRLGLWLVILGLWIWLQLYVALLLAKTMNEQLSFFSEDS